jgi:hypothetical protein
VSVVSFFIARESLLLASLLPKGQLLNLFSDLPGVEIGAFLITMFCFPYYRVGAGRVIFTVRRGLLLA